VRTFGASCHLPGSFQGPVVAMLYAPDYVEAVRVSILGGGDQASRSIVAGAVMAAAAGGGDAVPQPWRNKVTRLAEIEALVDELLKKRFADELGD
jgi:ADP-ribosylglycohydrolase